MVYIPEQSITRLVSIISGAMAVVLLWVAIFTLHAISSPKAKLGMVGFYMLVFAMSVGLLTTAKRSEIFAATAA